MNEKIGEFLFLIEGVPKKPEYVDIKYLLIHYKHTHTYLFSLIDHFPYQAKKQ